LIDLNKAESRRRRAASPGGRDRRLHYASAFVRAMATSTAGVTVDSFLGTLDAGARHGDLGGPL
jgi:hypothetical protein